MTLYETIVKNSIDTPDRAAYHYLGMVRTHKQMLADVDRTADALAALGIGIGDRIGLALPNCPKMLSLFYAANKIGAVAVMINPKSPADELYRQITMTDCKALFFSTIAYKAVTGMYEHGITMPLVAVSIFDYMPLSVRIALSWRMKNAPKKGGFLRSYPENGLEFKTFIHGSRNAKAEPATYDDSREAVVIFSGGTNGTFKAVVHSSRGLYDSAVNCLKTEEPWPEEVSMLAILPAFHIFGLTVAIHLPLVAGGYIELVPVFNLGIITRIIKKGCPSFFPGVPTIFERLLKYPSFAKLAAQGKLNFSGFRHGFVGGDTLSDEVRDAFNEVVRRNGGDGYISMGYGMSECCPICVNNRTSARPESIGIPFDTTKVLILKERDETASDENLKEDHCEKTTTDNRNAFDKADILPEGEAGEIAIASSYMMLYGFDEEGKKNIPWQRIIDYSSVMSADGGERWLRTGDIGYIKDGLLYYRCRQRRIIKVSGNTIFADSIERTIEEGLPEIQKAYVVPVPHAQRGHVAFAFAIAESSMTDEELLEKVQRICRSRMLPYAIPVGAKVVEEKDIPHTAIGKVAWGLLEKQAVRKMEH